MDYNPFVPEVRENPFPYYTYLRQHAPVYQVPGAGFWVISRYDDVLAALKSPQVFSSSIIISGFTGDLDPFPPEAPAIIAHDPPDHTRLRKLVNRAFTPRRVASLEAHIREVTHHLLEQIPTQGEFDLVRALSSPLPTITIAELLGVPPEQRDDFKRWTYAFARATNGMAVPPEARGELRQSMSEFRAYLQEAIAAYRKKPGDNLLSDLLRAEEENQTLTVEEIASLAMFLVIAGSETTTNLIANAILALSEYPKQMDMVRTNLALIPNVVEETLRYDGPIQNLFRQVTQDVEVAGTCIPTGSPVLLLVGSANRDERKFPDPDRYDILRNTEGHVALGFGVHFCLGAQLARLEATVALTALLGKFPRLARTQEHLTRVESPVARGPKTLPLVVA